MEKLFIEELPLNLVLATEKELEKRLYREELNLATKCSPCAAYITLNLKNGTQLYVARDSKWNESKKSYDYIVQILNKSFEVVYAYTYDETWKYPLQGLAMKIIRMNKR